ncbi:MAG: Crp/Fnr family transcriptional regulator [Anaerolineae bacterium]|nr:Crp/Fnr family transcriptional regulator [Anaerolineae bacterium]
MISPELLRRYPFFGFLTPEQQRTVAMIAEEVTVPAGEALFHSGEPASHFYLLTEGSIDLNYDVNDSLKTGKKARYYVGTVNPGEPLAISALIEPYVLTTTAVAANTSRLIAIDAAALRELVETDSELAYPLLRQVAHAAMERLQATRIELLAATGTPNGAPALDLA